MKKYIFLTTSHNQKDQVFFLLENLKKISDFDFLLVVVESGHCKYDKTDSNIISLYSNNDAFWAESNSIGLKFIYDRYDDFSLIILNCDIHLTDWSQIKKLRQLSTYYTIDENTIVNRSGFNISNWYLAKHSYPYLGMLSKDVTKIEVSTVPTRFIFIPREYTSNIRDILPDYKKLPHYSSDLAFTFEISNRLKMRWIIQIDTFIVEDLSSTGIKSGNSNLLSRIKNMNNIKSIYRPSDRINLSLKLTSDKNIIVRFSNLVSSLLKLTIQILN
jgi:hypothetical protein